MLQLAKGDFPDKCKATPQSFKVHLRLLFSHWALKPKNLFCFSITLNYLLGLENTSNGTLIRALCWWTQEPHLNSGSVHPAQWLLPALLAYWWVLLQGCWTYIVGSFVLSLVVLPGWTLDLCCCLPSSSASCCPEWSPWYG